MLSHVIVLNAQPSLAGRRHLVHSPLQETEIGSEIRFESKLSLYLAVGYWIDNLTSLNLTGADIPNEINNGRDGAAQI